MSHVSYLGHKISIITKAEIRYEGILYTLDLKESTLALAKVRSFGTENRPTDRPIAPRDEIYEYIIFRGNDIKDLQVYEIPKPQHGLPSDPAILHHSAPMSTTYSQPFNALCGLTMQSFQSQPSYSHFPSVLTPAQYSSTNRVPSQTTKKSPTSDAGVQVSVGGDTRRPPSRMERENFRPRSRDRSQQGSQNRRQIPVRSRQSIGSRRMGLPRRGRPRSSSAPTTERFESEYDFEQANAEFQELESKLAKSSLSDAADPNPTPDDTSYDRKKSFDDISCEATRRSKGLPNFDWNKERKLNVETFGIRASNMWLRRRRGRGGYRRGSYRGRGGNYNRPVESQKTVTFNEVPTIKEVEIVTIEDKTETIPVVEVVEESKVDLQEPTPKPENVWK